MQIDLVSFTIEDSINAVKYKRNNNIDTRADLFCDIANETKADILVFSGWTIHYPSELQSICNKIINKNTSVFFEVYDDSRNGLDRNRGYIIQGGQLYDPNTHQYFATSSDVNNNDELIGKFLDHIEQHRVVQTSLGIVLWLVCGEINVLKNNQSYGNEVVFRSSNPILTNRFQKLLGAAHIVINPLHSPMGNQGKMHKRREYFSSGDRIYCSIANLDNSGLNDNEVVSAMRRLRLQYLYHNGQALYGEEVDVTQKYLWKKYVIG